MKLAHEEPALCSATPAKRGKVLSFEDAAALVRDGDTVTICGAWMLLPDTMLRVLGSRFAQTNHPRDLTLVFPFSPADNFTQAGIEHLAQEGMLKRLIGGSFPCGIKSSRIMELITSGKVESYNLPAGALMHLFREIARKSPGLLTRVGLGTCVDPRMGGGRMNAATREDLVEVVNLRGEEFLFYPSFPTHVALIRGTTADEHGNISMEDEAAYLGALAQALAAHNCGGKVIAQVRRVSSKPLPAKSVKIPGVLVDAVVVDPAQMQAANVAYDPSLSGEEFAPMQNAPLPLSAEKIIARRLSREITDGSVVVLGFGIASMVPAILAEEERSGSATFLIEQGAVGGTPLSGFQFGCARNPHAFLDCPMQFDLFQGGGFDAAFLSFMQVAEDGRINVSKLRNRPTVSAGVGGFMDIANNARKLVFAGTLTTSGLDVQVRDGKLQIVQEGAKKKLVKQLDQVTFDPALTRNGQILFVTERCVLELRNGRLTLVEIAPGIDRDDIESQSEFPIATAPDLKRMDASLFAP
jgi:propionate CoA-transferase